MSPVEALQIALSKEKAAIDLYRDLAAKYPEVRELANSLENEEHKHKRMIEERIVQLTKI